MNEKPNTKKIYPRTKDFTTVYLKNVITNPNIIVGDGAIIGTRTLVAKDVPPYSIVGGMPAKLIRKRFEDSVIEDLLKIKWWDWSTEKISEKLSDIRRGNIEALKE